MNSLRVFLLILSVLILSAICALPPLPQPSANVGLACTAPACQYGQLTCGSPNGCPGGCGTVCQPQYICTAPSCEGGKLACGSVDGCPGGCGTICLPATPTPMGSVVFDFASQVCSAQWMNGGQALTACPAESADRSGGFAELTDPIPEGFPHDVLVLRTIPSWNGYGSLFLRYPPITIDAKDRFQTTLSCDYSLPSCDVQFALEYYDVDGKYHSPFMEWNLKNGDAPLYVDASLAELAGQKVDLLLVIRLFHSIDTPEQDNGLWAAPRIFRPLQ